MLGPVRPHSGRNSRLFCKKKKKKKKEGSVLKKRGSLADSEEQEKTENYVCERGFLQRNESAHVRVITIENSLTHRCLNATGNASPGPAGKRRVPNAFALARNRISCLIMSAPSEFTAPLVSNTMAAKSYREPTKPAS